MTTCKCDNCDWTGDEAELTLTIAETPYLKLRLDAGSTVPAGECPECGCFAYLVPEAKGTYTVLLARPDGIANDSLDTYLTSAEGDTPQAAVDAARLEACAADDWDTEDAIDYAVLLVIAGEHDDLSYLIDNEGVK